MHQSLLISQLHSIFPAEQILVNSRTLSHLRDPGTESILELDAFIPSFNIAFEFQDDYHYITTWYNQESLRTIREKDDIKKQISHQNQITLIVIPNWWDGRVESLMATIRFHRPDTDLEALGLPIPFNSHADHFQNREIPGVNGELMQASFPSDISLLDFSNDDWWLGEKYDGVRCCWNPVQKVAYTRTGKELSLLPSVVSALSPVLLDCEIWFGRGQFGLTGVLVKSFSEYVQWDFLRVIAFDIPGALCKNSLFEERYAQLVSKVPTDHELIHVASRILAKSEAHMKFLLNIVLENSGEGLIARKVGSVYENGRSSALLKIKNVTGDQEGIVVGIDKHNGVHLRMINGAVISVPLENVLTKLPSVGDVVTFCFESFKRRSEPENPRIIRIRTDVSWQDLVRDSPGKSVPQHGLSMETQILQKMRNFMESFARRKNMDPLRAETWHSIPYESIYQCRTGRIILKKFRGYFKALRQLFPEINFNSSINSQASAWHEIANRRKFFENYARENKFDPLNPNNWYAQPKQKFMAVQGAYRVISYHNNSFFRSLLDLFPDIGLEKSKLWLRSWGDLGSRRKFFENFAREHGFDPQIAEHWYAQSRKRILATRGAKNVIRYHKNSVTKALVDLFPTIGLQKSKLWIKPSIKEKANRRKFFENYAKENGFDPLNPEKWYSQPNKKILLVKGAKKVVSFHRDSVAQALEDLFPEIGFEKNQFASRHLWNDSSLRRKVFEDYAREHGFDPLVPENWYNQPRRSIVAFKGASGPIRYYGHSVSKALIDCFPEIGLEAEKFGWVLPDWKEPKNRRAFFEKYAAENGFDPLSPASWYAQQRENIMSSKGASRVISYHNGSVSKALLDLFPEIGLEKFKMGISTWVDINNRRNFFKTYAQEHKFDPLHAREWYLQPKSRIMEQKGAVKVMAYHQNSIAKALLDCFPDIGLDSTRFLWAQSHWQDEKNRRKFFENYAKENSFDPLIAEKWYSQRKEDIMARKGAFSIVNYYKCSLPNAIISLFPETNFVKSKFNSGRVSKNQQN
eukprot:Phypoly_transcript_01629.p1 GENE.Phypoly_transcript_01629~~Phypoly_transcript_01629.p1  ORF type:complete len:1030 (-),score=139.53 Phypoly_transcript_01629:75-3164(-)